uniref:Uncharacterized protein n=1 Tax=Amorphochlora amoebiformis TaxID=1561963 RepID=A0A7S0DHD1_9EUKA
MKAEEDKKEKKDNKGRKPVSKEPAPISAAVKRYKFKCHESLYRNLKGAYQSTYGYTGTYAERLCCPLKMKSNVRSDDSDDEEEIHGDDKA